MTPTTNPTPQDKGGEDDHHFSPFKSEEKICWSCGFVIPREASTTEIAQLFDDCGIRHECPRAWHAWNPSMKGAKT